MIGITLTSEQIRTAPPDVRHWIEREVMASFGQPSQPKDEPRGEHLAVCSQAQAEAVLAQIQGVLPVVNVFFALGRQGAIFGPSHPAVGCEPGGSLPRHHQPSLQQRLRRRHGAILRARP
jgi:hypothetical protein